MVFFALIPFGMMAAVNLPSVGGVSIMAYDIILLTVGTQLLFRRGLEQDLGRLLAPRRGGMLLLAFMLYATFATLFLPRVFAGATEVFSIGRVAGQIGIVSRPLAPGGGNVSQLLRQMLSILAFAVPAVVMIRRGDLRLALTAMVAFSASHAALGIVDLLTQMTGTSFVMAPIRTANYALTLGQEMAGLNRLIGGFPEASSYGYASLGLFAFWLGYWFEDRSGRRLPLAMLLLFGFLVLRGTSSSAYVGAALLIFFFFAMRLRDAGGAGTGRMDGRVFFALLAALALVPCITVGLYTMYQTLPGFSEFIDRSLLNKLSSDSGVERMSWNVQALRNFVDTNLLGAGLGSVRASNWIAAVLGCTGLAGLVLLVAYLWQIFATRTEALPDGGRAVAAGLKLGLAGLMARALVVKATPNLDFAFFAMAGLLVGLAIHHNRRSARAGSVAPDQGVVA